MITGIKMAASNVVFRRLSIHKSPLMERIYEQSPLYRSVDDVGNLCETREKSDRVYGAGSRLLETKDAKFSYDEEGNLIEKVENNGDTWKYEYYGNGMMSKIIDPDLTEVTFKYDSLGRRIEKSTDEKTMRFVWDGNTILHEYDSQSDLVERENLVGSQNESELPDNLVTWVFNDGFVPSAKITSAGNYSIISDYLGTPVEAYDEEGNKVWSAELDIYGRVKEFTGEKDFIPFRYQGQYEDVEIGLYYNRFRYYDPEQGNYTQIDPIGLAGGNPTLYGYVSDTNTLIDIFGLSCTKARGSGKGTDENNYVYFNKTHKNSLPKPKGDGPNGGKLQSHHGLQQEWAKNNLSQYGYDPKLAPTVTIETGKGLPHTLITNAQTARRNNRVASGVGKWSTTLQEELQFIVGDLTKAGFSRNTTSQVLEQQYKMLDKLGVKYERIDY